MRGNHRHTSEGRISPTYISWNSMKQRCLYARHKNYYAYGGRGITVCERWKNSFSYFLEDMGIRPEGTSLDRIDPNGNYGPENCRWLPKSEQMSNTRNNRLVLYHGESMTASELSRRIGVPKWTLFRWVWSGKDIDVEINKINSPNRQPEKWERNKR